MAQASAATLRRLRRRRDPTAALLSSRLLSSSFPGLLLRPKQPAGPGASATSSTCSSCSSLCTWFGSRSCPRPPRRQHAANTARARAVHHAALSSGSSTATVSSEPNTPASQSELLHFIKSTFGRLEGQNHCWLNAKNGIWMTFNQEGIYLVLLYQSCETLSSNSKHSAAFESLKYLQQSYPRLNVFAMQYGSGISSLAAQCQAVRTIMKEYITFPILMSDKDFTNVRHISLQFSLRTGARAGAEPSAQAAAAATSTARGGSSGSRRLLRPEQQPRKGGGEEARGEQRRGGIAATPEAAQRRGRSLLHQSTAAASSSQSSSSSRGVVSDHGGGRGARSGGDGGRRGRRGGSQG